MNKKAKIIGIILTAAILLGTGFLLGRHSCPNQIIEPAFEIHSTDSLGVYRFMDIEHYISADKKLKVDISYVQFGESDSFYQLKLSTEEEPYYGHMFYTDEITGIFSSPSTPKPIKFYSKPVKYANGRIEDTDFIIINNKNIPLKLIQQDY